jgi:hypothetical protein
MKNMMKMGSKGTINQIALWASMFTVTFKLPVNNIISKIAEVNISS